MRIPRKLKDGQGPAWQVQRPMVVDRADRRCIGRVSWRKREVRVQKGLPLAEAGKVLLHELTHIADPSLGERRVERLSGRLYALLTENGLLR